MDQNLNILPVNIEEELKTSFLDYSMSVIVSRALPDVRDGLKPVHRRILFAMNQLKNFQNRPYLKSARIVGRSILRVRRPVVEDTRFFNHICKRAVSDSETAGMEPD